MKYQGMPAWQVGLRKVLFTLLVMLAVVGINLIVYAS